MLRDMFKKTYIRLDNVRTAIKQEVTPEVPHGMWRQCKKCSSAIYAEDVKKNLYICPKCSSYFRIHANRRIEMITDEGSFIEWNTTMEISNPLDFPDYENKLEQARQKTKLDEAVVTGRAEIAGEPTVICACDARFMMGSMGHNVGEKICYAVERAAKEKLPVIIFACSGGARMQEGIISLMQMAKTSAALRKLHEAGQVYISFLTDPTTGGVTASFAMLGDIILAEPKALIGFAGPRVIAQTIGAKLPEGFQRSEFLLEHGFIDAIVERKDQRDILANILKLHSTKTDIALKALKKTQEEQAIYSIKDNTKNNCSDNIDNEVKDIEMLNFSEDDDTKVAWDSVINSRKSDRPTSKDYIEALFSDFIELHGDRAFGDDGAIIGGIAMFHGIPVTVIGQQKGRSIKENKSRNFGMPSPEGYRKALRLMKGADDFGRPIICLVDTPGAFCGLEAEERGQGEAIARNLYEMSAMTVPILTIVIGEGGSGGALAMAVANQVWMMQHAIYSILSPEGFASILYKDAKKCKEAAEDMKITAPELLKLGIIEKIIPERIPASKDTIQELTLIINEEIILFIDKYSRLSKEEIVNERYNRFRKF